MSTLACTGCQGELPGVEGGLQLLLLGDYGSSCETHGLDHLSIVDYRGGETAFFYGDHDCYPDCDAQCDEVGLGGCLNKVSVDKGPFKNYVILLKGERGGLFLP